MPANDDIEAVVSDIRRKAGLLPLADAVVLSHESVEAWLHGLDEVADLRRFMLQRAKAQGWTNADLAALLGISRQRISKVLTQPSRSKTHTQGKGST